MVVWRDGTIRNPEGLNGRDLWQRKHIAQAQMVLTDGGAGDLIACLVAAKYNVDTCTGTTWTIFCPNYLRPLARHLIPGVEIIPFSEAKKHFRQDLKTWTTEWMSGHTPMRTHPVDYGFHMLADRHVDDMSKKNYLQIRPKEMHIMEVAAPNKRVCIQATGAEPCKTLTGSVINEISRYVYDKGYTPVYMGKRESQTGVKGLTVHSTDSDADLSLGIDMIDATGLLEAARVIHGAAAFVGMDGGLMHLAGCTTTPIVCGFTLVSPLQVAPIRASNQAHKFWPIEPDESIPNRYYQSVCPVTAHGDARQFKGWERVLADLTADKFIARLENIL